MVRSTDKNDVLILFSEILDAGGIDELIQKAVHILYRGEGLYTTYTLKEVKSIEILCEKAYKITPKPVFKILALYAKEICIRSEDPLKNWELLKKLFNLTASHEQELPERLVMAIYFRFIHQALTRRKFRLYNRAIGIFEEFLAGSKWAKDKNTFLDLFELQHLLAVGHFEKLLERENEVKEKVFGSNIEYQKILSGFLYRFLAHANFGIKNYKLAEFYYDLSAEDFLLAEKYCHAIISLFWKVRIPIKLRKTELIDKQLHEIIKICAQLDIHPKAVIPFIRVAGGIKSFIEGKFNIAELNLKKALRSGIGFRLRSFLYPYLALISYIKGKRQEGLHWAELALKSQKDYFLWGGTEPLLIYYQLLLEEGKKREASTTLQKIRKLCRRGTLKVDVNFLELSYNLYFDEIDGHSEKVQKVIEDKDSSSYIRGSLFHQYLKRLITENRFKDAFLLLKKYKDIFYQLIPKLYNEEKISQLATLLQNIAIQVHLKNNEEKTALFMLRWLTSNVFEKRSPTFHRIKLPFNFNLIEYFYSGDEVYIFLRNGEKTITVEAQGFSKILKRLKTRAKSFADKEILENLYSTLIHPIQRYLLSNNLVIIPYGRMIHIPFNILHDGEGFLFEKYNISILPAYRILASGYFKKNYDTFLGLAITEVEKRHFPFARWEIEKASRFFVRSTILINEESERFFSLVPHFDVIHLATHSVAVEDDPLRSFYTLKRDGAKIKPLAIKDLLYLKYSRNPMLVISSCSLWKAFFPEEESIYSVLNTLFERGVSGILITRTELGDKEAMLIMEEFYTELSQGKRPFMALSSTLRKLIHLFDIHNPELLGSYVYFGL